MTCRRGELGSRRAQPRGAHRGRETAAPSSHLPAAADAERISTILPSKLVATGNATGASGNTDAPTGNATGATGNATGTFSIRRLGFTHERLGPPGATRGTDWAPGAATRRGDSGTREATR